MSPGKTRLFVDEIPKSIKAGWLGTMGARAMRAGKLIPTPRNR
jgi:hypothetical protein